ncbi:MAG TPA: glycosyltransferase [Burkholderiaceae bacterium]|nr:glycosyltransferase [Burkholderiaceae bacterium]
MMPIRVLHVIHSLDGGGAERQLTLLANASAAHGMTAAVACVNDAGQERLVPQVGVFRIRRRRRLDHRVLLDVTAAIDRFRPGIVHAWLPAVVTVPAMLAATLRRVPVLFSYRMAMRHDAPLKPIEWLVASACATGVLSNTDPAWCTRSYRWLYRRKRGLCIANGVEPNAVATNCRARHAHAGPLELLFAGRLSTQKNWPRLLDAMAALKSSTDVRLTVYGRGEQQAQVEQRIADLGLQDCVTMAGYQSNLRELMPHFDALVMPSLWEGMPNVVLEAMAAGLPCVLSDIPEHRKVCGAAGVALFFDVESSSQLADAVRALAASPERRRAMSDAGISRSESFSVASMVSRHAEAYRAMLAASGATLSALDQPAAGR